MISMIVVLTVLTLISGGLLAAVQSGTEEQIEIQILKFQKAPAIESIFPEDTPKNNLGRPSFLKSLSLCQSGWEIIPTLYPSASRDLAIITGPKLG